VIDAVNGVLLSLDDAVVLLGALDKQDPPPNVRILALRLRRAVAMAGDSANRNASAPMPRLPGERIANASSNARNPLLQSNSVHYGDRELLGSAEAATVLGITPNGVRDLRRRGVLRAERVGGRWRFSAVEIAAHADTTKK
jgi:excisionase family DNA binding protein